MRIWCDEIGLKTITYHPLCHLEIHEKDGIKELHNIKTILLGESHRLFTLEDLKSIDEKISTLLIELPQREIGGVLPTWDELLEISKYCKEKGIKLHLDGARLFESVPFYDKTLNDICSIFDSVYISFYKGLGGIAGAILAGDENFIEKSKIWKRRHGGDLISLYPYIISAKYNYNQRKDKMNEYWESAKYCAKIINTVKGIRTEPLVPMCNMFHVHFDYSKDYLENILEKLSIKYNLGTIPYFQVINENSCKTEMSFGDNFSHVDKDIMEKYFYELNMEL
jgi:threonine aldolase